LPIGRFCSGVQQKKSGLSSGDRTKPGEADTNPASKRSLPMLSRLATKIADAIDFLLNLSSWMDDRPTSADFERKFLQEPKPTPQPVRAKP